MKYKCIIFDNDGILVDSEAISSQVFIEMAKELGVKINLEFAIENFSGVSIKSTLEYISNKAGKELSDDFEKEFRRRTFELFKTDLKPVKGVAKLLDKITVPYCVASSGPREKLQLSLQTTNLLAKFENRIYSSYDIGSWKPNPEIFLYAAKEMGYEPNKCAVIEDSLAGVKAAKAGGFDVFAFANERNKKTMQELGATVFFDMNELYELLQNA
ncbi:MAG: HAD-IA family hydrolase [Prolixibacteraceae bacterium]|jgi:HAD superfamily hydrolase (TIGR01509 family)